MTTPREATSGTFALRYAASPAVTLRTSTRFIFCGPAPRMPRRPAVPNSSWPSNDSWRSRCEAAPNGAGAKGRHQLGRGRLLLLHARDQAVEAFLADDRVELRLVVLDEPDAGGLDVPRLELVAVLLEDVVDLDLVRAAVALRVDRRRDDRVAVLVRRLAGVVDRVLEVRRL